MKFIKENTKKTSLLITLVLHIHIFSACPDVAANSESWKSHKMNSSL